VANTETGLIGKLKMTPFGRVSLVIQVTRNFVLFFGAVALCLAAANTYRAAESANALAEQLNAETAALREEWIETIRPVCADWWRFRQKQLNTSTNDALEATCSRAGLSSAVVN
jgi:hypothetical protein